ncbi:hypothetical protein TRVA0_115S00100 [Trichomonascus vanleenenianus]|uniref:uncharacterized protein n=1 Tax=Trichomonascus vanleenenianus TaxID=2268995 RepID=UPI003ECA8C9E
MRNISKNKDESFLRNNMVTEIATLVRENMEVQEAVAIDLRPLDFTHRTRSDELPEDSIEAFHDEELVSLHLGMLEEYREVSEEVSSLIRDAREEAPLLDPTEHDLLDDVEDCLSTGTNSAYPQSIQELLHGLKEKYPATMCVLELAGMGGFSLEVGEQFIRKMKEIHQLTGGDIISIKAALIHLRRIFESKRVDDNRTGKNLKGTNCYVVYYCENGCMAFTGEYTNAEICEVCKTPNHNQYWYLFLSPREWIRKLFRDAKTAESMLKNRERGDEELDYNRSSTTISDVWDSEGFRDLKKKSIKSFHSSGGYITDGKKYFETSHEISLTLAADGVNPFSFKPQEIVTLCLVNNNLNQEVRQLKENVHIPMAFPKVAEKVIREAAQNKSTRRFRPMYDTFLQPLIDDFAEMGIGFNVYDASIQKIVNVKMHLTQVTGDLPAVAYLMQMKGHLAKYPCRTCKSMRECGTQHDHESNTDRKYGGVLPNETTSNDIRKHDEFKEILKEHEKMYNDEKVTEAQLNDYQREHGIKGSSIFFRLGSIEMPWSFVPDAMHMIHVNIAKSMLSLLGDEEKSNLNSKARRKLDKILQAFNIHLPSTLGGKDFPENFFRFGLKSNTKAIVWKRLLELFPSLIYCLWVNLPEYLVRKDEEKQCREFLGFMLELTEMCNQITHSSISIGDLKRLEKAISHFEAIFQYRVYKEDDLLTLNYFTLPLHMLTHICAYIKRSGIPRHNWCFTMERSCRTIKLLSQGCKFPIKAISNKLLLHFYAKLMDNKAEPKASTDFRVYGKVHAFEDMDFDENLLSLSMDELWSDMKRAMNKYITKFRLRQGDKCHAIRVYGMVRDERQVRVFNSAVIRGNRYRTGDAVFFYERIDGQAICAGAYGIICCFVRAEVDLEPPFKNREDIVAQKDADLSFVVLRHFSQDRRLEYNSQLFAPRSVAVERLLMDSAKATNRYSFCHISSPMRPILKFPLSDQGTSRMAFIETNVKDDCRMAVFPSNL